MTDREIYAEVRGSLMRFAASLVGADDAAETIFWTGEVACVFGGVETCGHPNFIAGGDGAVDDPEDDEWRVLGDG